MNLGVDEMLEQIRLTKQIRVSLHRVRNLLFKGYQFALPLQSNGTRWRHTFALSIATLLTTKSPACPLFSALFFFLSASAFAFANLEGDIDTSPSASISSSYVTGWRGMRIPPFCNQDTVLTSTDSSSLSMSRFTCSSSSSCGSSGVWLTFTKHNQHSQQKTPGKTPKVENIT
jgi:hypothetical protein